MNKALNSPLVCYMSRNNVVDACKEVEAWSQKNGPALRIGKFEVRESIMEFERINAHVFISHCGNTHREQLLNRCNLTLLAIEAKYGVWLLPGTSRSTTTLERIVVADAKWLTKHPKRCSRDRQGQLWYEC